MNKKELSYINVYKRIRSDIESGAYNNGDKLPSKRVLADSFNVSVITVEHACALLSDEGYIRPEQRRGYFVSYKTDSHFSHPDEHISSTKSSFTPSNDDLSFSVYAKTVRKVLSEYSESTLERSPWNGAEALRISISRYLARSRGMNASAKQIIIGSGAEYLYGMIIKALGRERIYAVENPSYEKIALIYEAENVRTEKLKLEKNGINSRALSETSADVLHVTPYRSYPSGVSATASKKKEYIEWANRKGGIIIEDDYESEFTASTKAEDTLYALDNGENVIYVNTFSKTVSPSIRVGYIVLPYRMVHAFEQSVGFYSCTVPTLDQLILSTLIDSGDFERHLNRVRRKKRKQTK